MDRLKEKVALVTGGAQGIGRAIVERFADEGAAVGVADLNSDGARSVADTIRGEGGRSIGMSVDVSSGDSVREMVAMTRETFSRIDILVNNAGIHSRYATADCPEEEWDRMLAVNIKGVFLCCRAVMDEMIERGSGKIINFSSMAAKTGGVSASPPYAASKAAVSAYTFSLAKELGPHGICVNALSPGIIKTEMTRAHPPSGDASIVLKHRRGEPEEVANAALFLASSESDYITGEVLDVNGGIWMD